MSKYEELCAAYVQSVHRHYDYLYACRDFATFLANGLAEYLESPREKVSFTHPDKQGEGEYYRECHHPLTVSFQDDGYIYTLMSIELVVSFGEDTRRNMKILFHLRIRKIQDDFIVRIKQTNINIEEEFHLNRENQEELNKFYDWLFNKSKLVFSGPYLDVTIRDFLNGESEQPN